MSELKPTPRSAGRSWMVAAFLLSLLFFVPLFLLMKPAAQASARAGVAAKHGLTQLDNEEGALLFQSMQIRRGESIYHPLQAPPYVAGTYTPLYMAAVAALDNFSRPSFATGRAVTWISALTVAVLLVLLTLVTTRNPALGVLTGFLFLATWEVFRWIGYYRVDFFAMALSLAGLAVVVSGGRRNVSLAVAALSLTLGLYAKQTMIAAPAACLVALMLRQPRLAFKFAAWMLAWGIPPMIALQISTGGEFLRHVIFYNVNTWHLFNLQVWSRHVGFMHQWIVLGVGLALPLFIMALAWQSLTERPSGQPTEEFDNGDAARPPLLFYFWQPLAWYALFAQWNFVAIAKAGSAENYLLEPIAGWAIILTLTAGAGLRLLQYFPTRHLRVAGVAAVIIPLAAATLHSLTLNNPDQFEMRFSASRNPGMYDLQADAEISRLVSEAENPFCELAIYHLRDRRQPVLQPFIMSELARQGKWDQQQFVEQIRAGSFDLVVTVEDVMSAVSSEIYTVEMLAAFQQSYGLERVVESPLWRQYILRPRDKGDMADGRHIAFSLGY